MQREARIHMMRSFWLCVFLAFFALVHGRPLQFVKPFVLPELRMGFYNTTWRNASRVSQVTKLSRFRNHTDFLLYSLQN